MKAMILAAGLGTRLKPMTLDKPKALIKLGDYTMLELTIRYLKKFGINEIVINVHHLANKIVDYIKKNNYFNIDIKFSDERCELLDTGGAIRKASNLLDGDDPFILMAVDVLTDLDLRAMMEYHRSNNALVTLAVKKRETSRSLLFDRDMKLVGWQNNVTGEKKGSDRENALYALGFSGIHIIQPEIFSKITEDGAFSIIDLYLRLMDDERIYGFRHDEDTWLEFGRLDRIESMVSSAEFKKLTDEL